ncbi:hypothetical protein [Streptomyces odonnellii]|uniref:hypothetical protein n=1 Tax=Streptomyces odonnellii TaxID=1417980 RepID=UPI0006263E36|nr:hypothetical protein [Streptomyces odonnellii]
MIRDLYNVREVPRPGDPAGGAEGGITPLTPEEEQRAHIALFNEIGNRVSDNGWARFPAYSPAERIRLYKVGRALSEWWGRPVRVEPEDECSVRFWLEADEPSGQLPQAQT